jgi:hypothetical protein
LIKQNGFADINFVMTGKHSLDYAEEEIKFNKSNCILQRGRE